MVLFRGNFSSLTSRRNIHFLLYLYKELYSIRNKFQYPVHGFIMNSYSLLLVLLAASNVYSDSTSKCEQKDVSISYLDTAADSISKARYYISTRLDCSKIVTRKPLDCADVFNMGFNKSGVYTIWTINRLTPNKGVDVYCDMDTDGGGWTLIQRRGNFQRHKNYFFKNWKRYKEGFGDAVKDFWLGNDNIFALTNQKLYSARFDLEDVELHKRYAQYDTFWIDDENHKYTLHIADYRGDAGDSMIDTNTDNHDNQKFSTAEQDNDNQKVQNCAELYKGGWWYNGCHRANLNGLYLRGKHESFADGIHWHSWKGYHESLESTEIKIRPKNFKLSYISTNTPM